MSTRKAEDLSDLSVIGVDIGKDVFHLVGFDAEGNLVLRRRIKRLALNATFEALPRCVIGMEACLSAHFVSRTLRGLGFEPRIIPAIYVRPFIKGQKNDYNDAEAIAEAALRPNLKTVTEKSQDQLDLQALHRVRSRLVSRRTATINQIRAFLIEQGITVRKGLRALKSSFLAILEERRDEMSPRTRLRAVSNSGPGIVFTGSDPGWKFIGANLIFSLGERQFSEAQHQDFRRTDVEYAFRSALGLILGGTTLCPSPVKLGHYTGHRRGTLNGEETTFRRRRFEAAA